MATQLSYLYGRIKNNYEIHLRTDSCFDKQVEWIHTVDETEFAQLLHGGELVFNSGTKCVDPNWTREYVKAVYESGASGIVISFKEGLDYPQDVVTFCNEHGFPLFDTPFETPFVDVMRIFSEILLKDEQNATNMTTALKQAIYYPENEEMYLNHFESNGLFRDMNYTVALMSCHKYDTKDGNNRILELERSIHANMQRVVSYNQEDMLVMLFTMVSPKKVASHLQKICEKDPNVYVGIGSSVKGLSKLQRSYDDAYTAYEITKTTIPKNLLVYDELGIYKLLANVKDKEISLNYAKEVLGNLLNYDKENGTEYVHILRSFFEHDCNILKTSAALYCHKNTLNYKMRAIRDILGIDVMENHNRMEIMLAFHILNLYQDT